MHVKAKFKALTVRIKPRRIGYALRRALLMNPNGVNQSNEVSVNTYFTSTSVRPSASPAGQDYLRSNPKDSLAEMIGCA